jgi:hypothetical protein
MALQSFLDLPVAVTYAQTRIRPPFEPDLLGVEVINGPSVRNEIRWPKAAARHEAGWS